MQLIKNLNKIKPTKGEDPKVMCKKIEALKVKYWDQTEILDSNTIVMHLFLVCMKLYKSGLMQVQVEAESNNMEIMYKSLIRCMNIACRIKSKREGVAHVGENKVVLMNTEFKEKCHACRKYGHKQYKCPKKNRLEEDKGNKKFMCKCNHYNKVGHSNIEVL